MPLNPCNTCKWYRAIDTERGKCRKHPPIAQPTIERILLNPGIRQIVTESVSPWPVVDGLLDACSEHQAAPPIEEPIPTPP